MEIKPSRVLEIKDVPRMTDVMKDPNLINLRTRLKKAKDELKPLISAHFDRKFLYSNIQNAINLQQIAGYINQITRSGIELPGNWTQLTNEI